MAESTLINLHPNEYRQAFGYDLFGVNLDGCMGSYTTFNDISNRLCVPKKGKNLNFSVFNWILGMHELISLTKHISFECKCNFGDKKCNWNQKRNNNKCWCESKDSKERCKCEEGSTGILLQVLAEMANI